MSPLRLARTAATLVLVSAPVSLAAQALAAGATHARPASRPGRRVSPRRVHVREHVAAAGLYDVHVVISTARLARNVIHVRIGALARRATTGLDGRAVIDAHLAIRGRTLSIRARSRWTRPSLSVSLHRVGALKKRPARKTRPRGAGAPTGTTGSTGATGTILTGATATVGATAATGPTTPATYRHVVVVIEESHAWIGDLTAPYLNGLAAQGVTFTNFHGVSHPSEPNYMAEVSGSTQATDGSDNCISSSAQSIAGLATAAGISVGSYGEQGANYACRHDPFSQFTDAAASNHPWTSWPTDFTTLPQISYVIPDASDDMGDAAPVATAVATGDAWARTNLDQYAQWAKANSSLLLVVTDELDGDPNYSSNQPGENGNQPSAIAVGAGVTAGTTNPGGFDHYSVLRTVEDIFGLGHLGASAAAADMVAP